MPRWLVRLVYPLVRAYRRVAQPRTLGVRVIAVRAGAVLLVRHTYQPGWSLPGGGVRRGESALEAAVRETLEETGAAIADLRLVGYEYARDEGTHDHVWIVRAVVVAEGRPRTGEIAAAQAFPLDRLPACAPRTARWLAALRRRELEASVAVRAAGSEV